MLQLLSDGTLTGEWQHTLLLACRCSIEGSTGCHEWSAGLRMAEFCLSNPDLFRGGLPLPWSAGVFGHQ